MSTLTATVEPTTSADRPLPLALRFCLDVTAAWLTAVGFGAAGLSLVRRGR